MEAETTKRRGGAFLTTREFSREVHLSASTVKRLCDAGKIAHVKLSPRGDRRIPISELDRLLTEAEMVRTMTADARTDGESLDFA